METIPGPFDPKQSWGATGADSLATLQLLLRLEKASGRKLTFELLYYDITATDIAQQIDRTDTALTSVADIDVAAVFLVPGVFGDEPILAGFRRSFGKRISFRVMELPELTASTRVLADIPATAGQVAEAIARHAPAGDIIRAGYSFGGCIAFEAARHLNAAGRRVALLVVLDTLLSTSNVDPSPCPVPGLSRQSKRSFVARVTRSIVDSRPIGAWRNLRWRNRRAIVLRLARGDAIRRLLITMARIVGSDAMKRLRQPLLLHFRTDAVRRWRAAPLAVPTMLVASVNSSSGSVERWRALCPELRIVHVSATHVGIFGPQALEILTPAFEDAVREARARIGMEPTVGR